MEIDLIFFLKITVTFFLKCCKEYLNILGEHLNFNNYLTSTEHPVIY